MKHAGRVVLILKDGSAREWPVRSEGGSEKEMLLRVFDSAKNLCAREIEMGGTLYLYDMTGKVLKEERNVV